MNKRKNKKEKDYNPPKGRAPECPLCEISEETIKRLKKKAQLEKEKKRGDKK